MLLSFEEKGTGAEHSDPFLCDIRDLGRNMLPGSQEGTYSWQWILLYKLFNPAHNHFIFVQACLIRLYEAYESKPCSHQAEIHVSMYVIVRKRENTDLPL